METKNENHIVFPGVGDQNTEAVLDAACKTAIERGVTHVVVATTSGHTGLAAAKKFSGTGVKVIAVTHNTGFSKENSQELDPARKSEMESLGCTVHVGTMPLRSIGNAIRSMSGNYSEEQIVATVLRMFGQGMKVVVEITAMAADAGLIPFKDVIAIAGTARGADTCAIVKADSSNRFFNIKIREIIAKPYNF